MATPSAPVTPPGPASVYLLSVRGRLLIAALALISLVTIFWLDLYAGGNSKGGPLLSAPFWLPYLFVILRLRKRPRSAIILAIAMSCAMLMPAIWLLLYARSWDANAWVQSGLAVIIAAQTALGLAAYWSLRRVAPQKREWQILVANGAYALIALIILTFFLRQAPHRITENEKSTLWMLQTIHKAASSYAAEFGGVYPAHLAALQASAGGEKPSCQAASFLSLPLGPSGQDTFESRGWGGEYVFEYEPGSPTVTAAGCTGVKSFELRARPLVYRKTGRHSFLLDASGSIHATIENRPARPSDPPFQSPK
jgi:hypothetical protein